MRGFDVRTSHHRARLGVSVRVGGALVLVSAAAALGLAVRSGGEGDVVRTQPVNLPPPTGYVMATQIPTEIPEPRVVQWTGNRVVVFGSDTALGDRGSGLAILDPPAGDWAIAEPPPFVAPLTQVDGFLVSNRLVVVGVECNNVATETDDAPVCLPGTLVAGVYDLSTEAWSRIDAPAEVRDQFPDGNDGSWGVGVGEWAGEAVFRIGNDYWAFTPDSGTWRSLPDPQSGMPCVVSDYLVAFTPLIAPGVSKDSVNEAPLAQSGVSLKTLRAGDSEWRESVMPTDRVDIDFFDRACAGSQVIVYQQSLSKIWSYSPSTGEWTTVVPPAPGLTVRPPPVEAVRQSPAPPGFQNVAWTGRTLTFWNAQFEMDRPEGLEEGPDRVVWPGNAVSYDPAERQWRTAIPGPPLSSFGHSTAWTDGFALVPTYQGEARTLATYRP